MELASMPLRVPSKTNATEQRGSRAQASRITVHFRKYLFKTDTNFGQVERKYSVLWAGVRWIINRATQPKKTAVSKQENAFQSSCSGNHYGVTTTRYTNGQRNFTKSSSTLRRIWNRSVIPFSTHITYELGIPLELIRYLLFFLNLRSVQRTYSSYFTFWTHLFVIIIGTFFILYSEGIRYLHQNEKTVCLFTGTVSVGKKGHVKILWGGFTEIDIRIWK